MGMVSIKTSVTCVGLVFGLLSAVAVQASIISTGVNASMQILGDNQVFEATANDSGVTSANVSITGSATGAAVHSILGFSSISPESIVFNFDIALIGANETSNGYLGQKFGNSGFINYFATSDTDVIINWDFDYTGNNPFGLGMVNLLNTNGSFLALGNIGIPSHHQGSTSFSLLSGNTYELGTWFTPNVSGSIHTINGNLSGAISFNFVKKDVVEPSGIALLGIGLLGLGLTRRRKVA